MARGGGGGQRGGARGRGPGRGGQDRGALWAPPSHVPAWIVTHPVIYVPEALHGEWDGYVFRARGVLLGMPWEMRRRVPARLETDGTVTPLAGDARGEAVPPVRRITAEEAEGPPVWLRDLGAPAPAAKPPRDFTFPDGYTFRQFPDNGEIWIVQSPRSKNVVKMTEASHPVAWRAARDAIEEAKAGKRAAAVAMVAQAAVALTAALTAASRKPKQRLPRARPVAPPVVVPAPGFPWVPVSVAILAGAVLLKLTRSYAPPRGT